jgi:hypothetical protein
VFDQDNFIQVVNCLTDLEEISFDANPISRDIYLKYYIILSMRSVEIIDDEKVTELDFELAESYFTENDMEIPKNKQEKVTASTEVNRDLKEGKENQHLAQLK